MAGRRATDFPSPALPGAGSTGLPRASTELSAFVRGSRLVARRACGTGWLPKPKWNLRGRDHRVKRARSPARLATATARDRSPVAAARPDEACQVLHATIIPSRCGRGPSARRGGTGEIRARPPADTPFLLLLLLLLTLRLRVQKIAFHLGSLPVHWYGLLLAIGFVLGLWTASHRAVRDRMAPEKILDSGAWLILGAIVGARALYVVSYWDRLFQEPLFPNAPWTEIFMVQRGGLVFYGGLIGATASGLIYVWKHKLPVWKFADALAPSIALGYVPGRIGCLMNGCCYGRATDAPWAIHFPGDHDTKGLSVHPTQIYDSLLNLGLYLALAWLHRRKKFDGQVFASYLICYALIRSLVEVFRGDYPARYLGGTATPAHLVSVAILAAGLILCWTLARRKPTRPA